MSLAFGNIIINNSISGTGVSTRDSVRVATTSAGTLATDFENGDTVDGITLATGNRILIKNQATGSENGIYTVNASGAPTRSIDFDAGQTAAGVFVFVEEGTVNADTGWLCTNNAGSDIVGTDALVFAQFTGGSGSGDVTGPASSTDNAIVRFNGTTGKIIQNSGVTVDDSNNMAGVGNLTFESGTFDTTITVTTQTTGAPTITIPDLAGTSGNFVITNATQTLTNKTLTTPRIDTAILDTNGNELVKFVVDSIAVNELTITNNRSGFNPSLSASGGDANVGIQYISKGGHTHVFSDTTSPGEIRINDASGGDSLGFKAPTSITSSYTLTFPAAQGANKQFLQNNGSGVLSWIGTTGQYVETKSFTDTSTTSSTYVDVSSFSATLPVTGDYLIMFSSSGGIDSSNKTGNYRIILTSSGAELGNSERVYVTGGAATTSMETALYTQATAAALSAADSVKVQWKTSGGTFTMHYRSLIIVLLG